MRVEDKEKKTGNIAKAIRKIIESTPFVKEAMAKGIVNYSAFAETIKDDVKRLTGSEKPISKESIVAAVIRYSKNIKSNFMSDNIIKTVANVSFSLKTNIRLLSLSKKNMKKTDFSKIYERFEIESEEQLIVFQGIKDIILVSDEPNYNYLSEYFKDRLEVLQENLAVFVIHSEGIDQYIPGYLEFFTSKLAEKGVNIEIYSSKEDLVILIEEKDVGTVYELLNSAKVNARGILKSKELVQ